MIQHIEFFKLTREVGDAKLEEMIRATRSILLKIPEVLSVRSGRNIDQNSDWPFFFSVEVESLEKLRIYKEDAMHFKFIETVIKPNTTECLVTDFETEPGRELKYS